MAMQPARVPAAVLPSSYEQDGLVNRVLGAKRVARPRILSASSLSRASTAEVFHTGLRLEGLESSPDTSPRGPTSQSAGSSGDLAPIPSTAGGLRSRKAPRPTPASPLLRLLLAVPPPPGLEGLLPPAAAALPVTVAGSPAFAERAAPSPRAAPQVAQPGSLPSASLRGVAADAAGPAAPGSGRGSDAAAVTAAVVEQLSWLSLGSIGHPVRCAAACRYVKKKGGCRAGADCPNCHVCYWRRDAAQGSGEAAEGSAEDQEKAQSGSTLRVLTEEELTVLAGAAGAISIGTLNHPHGCGRPCRHARRKGGCRDGVDCPDCHACLWTRVPGAGAVTQTQDGGQHSDDAPERSGAADVRGLRADPAARAEPLNPSGQTLEELIRLALCEVCAATN